MSPGQADDAQLWAALEHHYERFSECPSDKQQQYLEELERTAPRLAGLLRELSANQNLDFLKVKTWNLRVFPHKDEPPRRACEIGQLLDNRYEIEELLGYGGSGEVYRAYDRDRKTRIALKALRPELANNARAVASLRNEVNTATQVTHPNVCRLYHLEVAPLGSTRFSYITMECISGESLASRIKHERLSEMDALEIVSQVIDGLEEAHARGVVHRDLKPANILLTTGEAKTRAVITDFGLAREIRRGADHTLTVAEGVAGTPAYMSPEQLGGERPTKAFDIYALGVILFEMVTGRLPFEGDSALAIAAARIHRESPSPRKFEPGLDRRWEKTILQCLSRDPSRRPGSPSEILELLARPVKSVWPRWAVLGILAFGLGSGGVVWLLPTPRNPKAEAAFQRGLVFEQRLSPEGINHALHEFRRVTELEPKWAMAWLHLAEAYAAASNAGTIDPCTGLAEARKAAGRAIELDDRLAPAHGSFGVDVVAGSGPVAGCRSGIPARDSAGARRRGCAPVVRGAPAEAG